MGSENHYGGPLGGPLPVMASIKPAKWRSIWRRNRPNHTFLTLPPDFLPLPGVDGSSLVLHRERGLYPSTGQRETHLLST